MEIGGYFELELIPGSDPFPGWIPLNSSRNCLVALLRATGIRCLQLPALNCPVVEDAVRRFCPEVELTTYHVGPDFLPVASEIDPSQALYYVNYYGLMGHCLASLPGARLIIDNAQALYASPLTGMDTITCPRKFVGVSDGGFLKTEAPVPLSLVRDTSWEHSAHLLRRIDCGATSGYQAFQDADHGLTGKPPAEMSLLTRRILAGVDHGRIKAARKANFHILHAGLRETNPLSPMVSNALESDDFIPFFYPFMTPLARALRKFLISRSIYVPIFWPGIVGNGGLNEAEAKFVEEIVALPIDQRYGKAEMQTILAVIRDFYKE